MPSPTSPTGRMRRRPASRRVRIGDAVARTLITAGGIGTIAAVLLMALFLVAVALPLALPGRAAAVTPVAARPAADVMALGCDDGGTIGWWLDRHGPTLRCFAVDGGQPLLDVPVRAEWLHGVTALAVVPGHLDAVVGRADGTFRVGRIGLGGAFVPRAELPGGGGDGPIGSPRVEAGAIVVRAGEEIWTRITPVVEATGAPQVALAAAIVDVDLAAGPSGPIVAALAADGTARVEVATSRRDLRTDELTVTRAGATIPAAADGFRATWVRVTELGDQLFLFAADGRGRRYVIRDPGSPVLAEEFFAVPSGGVVTAVARVFGGGSFAVGDRDGAVHVLFTIRASAAVAADGLMTARARSIAPDRPGAAVVALAASPRSRLVAVADAGGGVRLVQATTGARVVDVPAGTGPAAALAIGLRERTLLAAGATGPWACRFDPGHPEISVRALVAPVWYENYPAAATVWETTGHEAFEPKYGFVPLVFGTLKSTFYSMLFAVPVALLAAIYSSQFLHPSWRARIKPVIEMMASLPSVVLGFVAGMVLAPLGERVAPAVLGGLCIVPLALLVGAHLWLLLPTAMRVRGAAWRFPVVGLVAMPAGCLAAWGSAPWLERVLFGGSLRAWLDGGAGGGLGGWVALVFPPAAAVVAVAVARGVNPWLRRRLAGWPARQAAVVSLVTLATAVAAAVLLAVLAGMFLDAWRVDPRGALVGGYVQRNAAVVAFGMGFAIIPLVFTIADDALSSVPEHLRSASLGAGATPWQTATRVIIPAAASGLFSAVMIGLGRAVGETMIVLMAAGNTPILEINPFNGFQTLSAAIATELPEAARGSTHYRVLFLAALALFAITFLVNTAAEIVRQGFRRRAHEL